MFFIGEKPIIGEAAIADIGVARWGCVNFKAWCSDFQEINYVFD